MARHKECVVIGAGLAGLAAAYRLSEKNCKVTVLEGRDRLGGRVLTHRFCEVADLNCELGAEWIGKNHTLMLSLCKELKLGVCSRTSLQIRSGTSLRLRH